MNDATNKTPSLLSGAAYVSVQADLASREGLPSATLCALFFECAVVGGTRTLEEWDRLVNEARRGETTLAEAIEYDE